jgi:hypothetical protein
MTLLFHLHALLVFLSTFELSFGSRSLNSLATASVLPFCTAFISPRQHFSLQLGPRSESRAVCDHLDEPVDLLDDPLRTLLTREKVAALNEFVPFEVLLCRFAQAKDVTRHLGPTPPCARRQAIATTLVKIRPTLAASAGRAELGGSESKWL